jgi:hypothetical protein
MLRETTVMAKNFMMKVISAGYWEEGRTKVKKLRTVK